MSDAKVAVITAGGGGMGAATVLFLYHNCQLLKFLLIY